MKLGIILPFKGEPNDLTECLNDLDLHVYYRPATIFISLDGECDVNGRYEIAVDVTVSDRGGEYVATANAGYKAARDWADLFIIWADDCRSFHYGWGGDVVKRYQEIFPNGGGLLCLNDGYWDGRLATHPVFDRRFVEMLDYPEGLVYPEDYIHFGADNEITERAKKAGCYAYAPEIRYLHPTPLERGGYESNKYKVDDAATLSRRRELY